MFRQYKESDNTRGTFFVELRGIHCSKNKEFAARAPCYNASTLGLVTNRDLTKHTKALPVRLMVSGGIV